MKIHEYQAKELLQAAGVAIQRGRVIEDAGNAREIIAKVQEETKSTAVMVKAQIHAGGRGKGGGVKYSPNAAAALENVNKILGMKLVTPQTGAAGQLVRKVLVTEAADIAREYYLAITMDRGTAQHILIASAEGGVEIEEIAKTAPEKIIKEGINPRFGLQNFQAYMVALRLGFTGEIIKQAMKLMKNLYAVFLNTDASMAEINPLVVTTQGTLMALDAKFNFDDNALYRHPNILAMRDLHEEDPAEVDATSFSLNYIKLSGNVGCMVNGAGLAMATMDIIKLKGGEPANFLDVGGGANVERVKNGFRIILSDPNVKAILVNIFGGIVRCDRVANGIVAAVKELDLNVPVVVRLEGTNAEEAKEILGNSEVSILPASSLDDAAAKVVAAVRK